MPYLKNIVKTDVKDLVPYVFFQEFCGFRSYLKKKKKWNSFRKAEELSLLLESGLSCQGCSDGLLGAQNGLCFDHI